MNIKLTKIERETLISFNAAEDTAELVMIRRMNKIVEENPEMFKGEVHSRFRDGEICAMNYIFPRRFVSIRTKDIKRILTEEQKQKARERMLEYNKSKSKQ